MKISKITLFWTFWKKDWLCLASWALFILKLYKAFKQQIAMISKVMIKFRSKFKFKIPLQFYRTVEKVETCLGNGQTIWQVPPSFPPSHFGYYFVFSWLRFKHTEYKGTLTWPTKFSPKGYSEGIIAWNINIFLPRFFTISSNLALLQLPNQNLYMVS